MSNQHNFFGLVHDKKLTFSSHIKTLKAKCMKTLNVLKMLSHRSWGADREAGYRVYTSVIHSKLDYACTVYRSARPSTLKCLDSVHHIGIRLIGGAFRTSSVESLYVELNERSLNNWRFYVGMIYALRIQSYPQHPAYPVVTETQFKHVSLKKPSVVPPFSMRIWQEMESHGFSEYSLPIVQLYNP